MAGKQRPTRASIDEARRLLAAGRTLREVAAATGLALSFLYKLGAHRRRRGPNVTRRERRNIERLLRAGILTQRAIGHRVQRAASTVNRVARLAGFPRRLRRPVRCPRHGWIKIVPCVACLAEAARRR